MKIALVILHADAKRGGAERYTLDLAAALARLGHDVSLLATTFGEIPPAAKAVRLDSRGLTRVHRYVRMLNALDAHLAAVQYDIVHAMLPVRRCGLYHPHAGVAAAALKGTKRKLEAIFNPRRITFAVVERELLRSKNPPRVLCLSEYVKREVLAHYDLDEAHLPKLFNGVDLDHFTAKRLAVSQSQPVRALFIGNDFARKGLPHALAAIEQLNDQDLSLTVIGNDRAPAIQSPRVNFIGPVPDPRPFYRDHDFLVLPTSHDPCSLVVLEALASGLPVITTKQNGASEIMIDGVHGFVLGDPSDERALAARMHDMLDPVRRAAMSAACIELRPALSYETHLRTLLSIYQSIHAAKNDSRPL